MKLTTGILAVAMMTGAGWAQSPSATNNQSNGAKTTPEQQTQPAKPTPGAPAPAVKPAVIPGAKPVLLSKPVSAPAAAKPVATPVKTSSTSAASQNNRLEGVKVVHNADDFQVEISPREAVTPRVSKLSKPARVVVELPGTIMATAQNKIPVGSAGVKGVRIGMDGKTPPTTSVVVDLDQAVSYELTPGPGNKLVLTLHTTQTEAKGIPAKEPVKAQSPAAKPTVVAAKVPTPTAKPAVVAVQGNAPKSAIAVVPAATSKAGTAPKIAIAAGPVQDQKSAKSPFAKPGGLKIVAITPDASKVPAKPASGPATKIAAQQTTAKNEIKKVEPPAPPKPEAKKWAMTGKRDPFFSPVVQQSAGSGCSTGKKCLDIGQINVRGVVKAESGFIAVVTNSLNKAYFLHENDPVFNGFVVKITGDSVVFQETMQDKLGKSFTREVVKRITTPAV